MELEKTILKYLLKRNGSLTWYQLDRKLSADSLHDLLPNLSQALNNLEVNGYIAAADPGDEIKAYSITDKGRSYIDTRGNIDDG